MQITKRTACRWTWCLCLCGTKPGQKRQQGWRLSHRCNTHIPQLSCATLVCFWHHGCAYAFCWKQNLPSQQHDVILHARVSSDFSTFVRLAFINITNDTAYKSRSSQSVTPKILLNYCTTCDYTCDCTCHLVKWYNFVEIMSFLQLCQPAVSQKCQVASVADWPHWHQCSSIWVKDPCAPLIGIPSKLMLSAYVQHLHMASGGLSVEVLVDLTVWWQLFSVNVPPLLFINLQHAIKLCRDSLSGHCLNAACMTANHVKGAHCFNLTQANA